MKRHFQIFRGPWAAVVLIVALAVHLGGAHFLRHWALATSLLAGGAALAFIMHVGLLGTLLGVLRHPKE